MILFTISFIVVLLLFKLYLSLTKNNDYWKKRNVPHLKPSLLFGNFRDYITFRKTQSAVVREICDQFPEEPYVGVFFGTAPALIVKDPKILKLVLTQDFYFFNGRENTDYADREPVTKNMFANGGDEWKVVRQNLTPLFTSAKLKNMFPTIAQCAEEMDTYIKEEMQIVENIDIKSLFARYGMEAIIRSVFGLKANTLKRESGVNPFVNIADAIITSSTSSALKNVTRSIWPDIFYALGFQVFDVRVEKFFNHLFRGARQNRSTEETSAKNFVDLILSWEKQQYITGDGFSNDDGNERKTKKIEVNEELLVAQCILFFAAGYETTSTTINYLLYELSKNKDAQEKVIEEVDAYFNKHGAIKYECVNELPYIEACVEETLRMYPVLTVLTREVMNNYVFPTGLRVKKGDRIHIPIDYLHRQPDFFPDPNTYRPERFFGDEKKNIKQYTYMPFGEGPRVCIGARFARMVMYAGLLTIFRKYRVELGDNMPHTLEFNPKSLVLQATVDMRVKFIPRDYYRVLQFVAVLLYYNLFCLDLCLTWKMILIFYLVILIVILFLYKIYVSLTQKNDYWKKKNVPYLKPKLLFGNFSDYILFKKSASNVTCEICEQFPDEPYVGVFYGTATALVIKDPKLLKLVLAQDFCYFNGRENTDYADREAATKSMFFTGGDFWKVLRQNLTPLFTSSKLKNMFPTIAECAEEMTTFLEEEKKISENIASKSLLARYSMDCIMNCIFGLRANTLKRDNGVNPFVIIGEKIFDTSTVRGLKIIARAIWPSLFYALGFKLFDEKIELFFKSLFIGARKNRSKDKSSMKNFVDLILSWEKESYITGYRINNCDSSEKNIERIEVNDDLLVAQCTSFFGAGFETTASTIDFLLYELAKCKRAQDIVLEEVDAYFNKHGVIKYECLNEMPYLEACIDETLRLYPTLGNVTREVMSSYTLPTGLRLQKGDRVHIPVDFIHRHPDYFPDPTSYRPERFFGEEKKKIKQFTFMPFGDGPRVCIGARFSKMVMYAGLLTIFRKYRIELPENMPLTLKLRPVSIVTQISTNLRVKFIPREL
ncbi:uncharacterized protein LOC124533044 [Vanessa cardui]|uniref:uncharacterized protein LOC124533044 n=1 Tax=Vanessa cardui TaxID=171605 RepID=UPI001F131F1C|nr:uncharacterized protein LOC124533044 [Vanessa cardui]